MKPASLIIIPIVALLFVGTILWIGPGLSVVHAQQPTVSIPTVTSTPTGPIATVNLDQDQINVRSGPGTVYPKVGVLLGGQRVVALGRSSQGLWIQVVYPGVEGGVAWVYSPLVTVTGGDLPIVEPPPTPTPRTTPTIDPTLAAQFLIDTPVPRLPTFTPPPPLVIPTFEPINPDIQPSGVPMGMIIIGLGVVGLFGGIISLLRGR
ncbi:MAG: SH3 domain-containing protein [Chloroflexota bacterium]